MNQAVKMEILIIPSWYPPDGGRIFKENAELLSSEQIRVSVLVNRLIGLTSHKIKEVITAGTSLESMENSIFVSRTSIIKLPYMEKLNVKRWIRKSLRQYKKYCKKHPIPDIIIAHSALWAGVVAERIKRIHAVPYILVEHRGRFTGDNKFADSMLKGWYRDLFLPVFTSANHIVCVSDSLKEGIQRNTNISADKFKVIPNMVDHEFFCLPVYQRVFPPFIFLSIGMLENVKGYDILLKAFAGFTEESEEEFILRIGGSGSQEKELRTLAHDLGIYDRVSFLGQISRERVRDEMQRANVFISASRCEAFGIVLVEAAMTGLPLITTLSGGAQSIVNDNNGMLEESEDPDGLKNTMKKMYLNYSHYNQELIRKQAVEKYAGNIIITDYQNLIRRIVNGE